MLSSLSCASPSYILAGRTDLKSPWVSGSFQSTIKLGIHAQKHSVREAYVQDV